MIADPPSIQAGESACPTKPVRPHCAGIGFWFWWRRRSRLPIAGFLITISSLAFAQGRMEDGLKEMRAVAAVEDATEKAAVTPGPLTPAHELAGQMLLEMKRPAEALAEFEATMKKEPNRFRAVGGAAKAAADAGDRTKARAYYTQLRTICQSGDRPGRPELREARAFAR